jgi:hypothetical protein
MSVHLEIAFSDYPSYCWKILMISRSKLSWIGHHQKSFAGSQHETDHDFCQVRHMMIACSPPSELHRGIRGLTQHFCADPGKYYRQPRRHYDEAAVSFSVSHMTLLAFPRLFGRYQSQPKNQMRFRFL